MSSLEIMLYLVGGFIAGTVNGLLGIGCGVVIVPLLISMQWDVAPAVATSHVGVFLSSAAATYLRRHSGFSFPRILTISMPAVVTAQLTTSLSAQLPPQVMLLGFSGLMFIDLDIMSAAQRKKEILSNETESKPLEQTFFPYIFIGLVTGVVASVFGLGGGLIVVPLLLILTDEPPKEAVRTSLGVMTATSLASLIPHAAGGTINYAVGSILGVTTIVGGLLGASLLPYVPNWALKRLISICIFMAGIHMYLFGITW